MFRFLRPAAVCCALAGLTGCVTIERAEPDRAATARLVRSDGAPAGTASLAGVGADLVLRVDATGLAAGLHGLHIHAAGRCERPDFASALGHWNPTARARQRQSGRQPRRRRPNLSVGADGRGSGEFRLIAEATASGLASLLDADGAALVIHAAADDMRTDPSGNSGARIACGVFVRR